MALNYGVLKGTVTGHLRDADDDHYQILVKAGNTMFRVAVNSHSQLSPPDLLFQSLHELPSSLTGELKALAHGFKKLPTRPGGLAQDFVRGELLKVAKFEVVPGDTPGADNDLKDELERAAVRAVSEPGAVVYAFGVRWGPEAGKKDKYFKFLPGNGVHDIHMNQGSSGRFAKDNGVFQDGCLIFEYPGAGAFAAFFMAFQSQTFDTDDRTGHPKGRGPVRKVAAKKTPAKKKKPARKKQPSKKQAPARKKSAGKARKRRG